MKKRVLAPRGLRRNAWRKVRKMEAADARAQGRKATPISWRLANDSMRREASYASLKRFLAQ